MAKSRPDIGPVGKMLLRSLTIELKQAGRMGKRQGRVMKYSKVRTYLSMEAHL